MKQSDQLLYYLNYILRNVIPCREICDITDGVEINEWIRENGYISKSSLLVRQLLVPDYTFDSNNSPEFTVAINSFRGNDIMLNIKDMSRVILRAMKWAKLGGLLATPTKEYCPSHLKDLSYHITEWLDMLDQLGSAVHVYNSDGGWSLFLVVKSGINNK